MKYYQLTKDLVEKISQEYKIPNHFKNLEKYVELLNEKNKIMNLTAFKNDVLWEKGIYESISMMLQILKSFDFTNKEVLDIGAGAGFPSVPFKIIYPNFQLTIHEPISKRINFLTEVCQILSLKIKLVKIRTEEVKHKNLFDLVVARAVSSSKVLMEISNLVLKLNGQAFFLKGPAIFEEEKDAQKIINILKIKVQIIKNEDSQITSDLYFIKLIKEVPTPAGYPRPWVIIERENKP